MKDAKNVKESDIAKQGIVAFIPVRGGSKSIPLKNIKLFCGKPLVYWVIKAASNCELIDMVYVATENESIRNTVQSFELPRVTVIDRSMKTATDFASTESAMLDFAEKYDFEHIILIQATSPLLETDDLANGIKKYIYQKVDSLLSVVRQKRFIWECTDTQAIPVNYDPSNRPLRQAWGGFFVENGAFYITRKDSLLKSKCRISGNISYYEMDESTYFELDEESDWIICEQLKHKKTHNTYLEQIDFNRINLLICDVDGVLTDGGMYYTNNFGESKKFNARDGKGIELIRNENIKVMFLTSENIDLVKDRANKLDIDFLYMGIKNKWDFLQKFYQDNSEFNFKQTAYIGDDVNDIKCLEAVYFSASPNDAVSEVKRIVNYVSSINGGAGCVREVCDLILSKRKRSNSVE